MDCFVASVRTSTKAVDWEYKQMLLRLQLSLVDNISSCLGLALVPLFARGMKPVQTI